MKNPKDYDSVEAAIDACMSCPDWRQAHRFGSDRAAAIEAAYNADENKAVEAKPITLQDVAPQKQASQAAGEEAETGPDASTDRPDTGVGPSN